MFVTGLLLIASASAPNLPITALPRAKYAENLCHYRYAVGTANADCQRYCDQAFGYYYSYVWMEAARSFETALQYDPDCASAWLGLSKALDKWGKSTTPKPDAMLALVGIGMQAKLPARYAQTPKDFALNQAKELMPKANHRERLLITAKLYERGMMPNTPPDDRRKKAQQTLDELITIYEDDEEGWFARAQLADGTNGGTPFYKALLRINPIHPGASHELVHFYENIQRPALGWPHAEKYMQSSPGIAHAFHMQAHLGMRIGKWQHTSDYSMRGIGLQRAYHTLLDVKAGDDHQFFHHLETLTRSLVHDGRFPEARQIRTESMGHSYNFRPEWFRLAVTAKDWPLAEEQVAAMRKANKLDAAYYGALLGFETGNLDRAKAELDTLRQAWQAKRGDRKQEARLQELQGRLACRNGDGENGVKLLKRIIDKTKNDYNHHAWGGGAYYMEVWGDGALECGLFAEAEEAYQEALAHDSGSVRGALGLWALCDRLGRTDEASHYLKLAQRCWARAEVQLFESLKAGYAAKVRSMETASGG